MLGCIKKGTNSRVKEAIILVYSSQCFSDYIWCSAFSFGLCYTKKNVERLEKVQRRATKMVKGLGSLTGEELLW